MSPRTILIAALLLALPHFARAEAPAPILETDARFHAVSAKNGMVVSDEPIATAIGRAVLQGGGNAVDAAVAVGFTLAVTHPRAGNLGGGGFMLVHAAASGDTITIDYRETAPAAATADMFLDAAGNADPDKSRFSPLAVGVPGTVAGLVLAHQRHGSGRVPLAHLVAPAIRLAEDGFAVSPALADAFAAAAPRLARDPATAAIFGHPDGSPLAAGEVLRQPDLARSLRLIAEFGSDAFYRGPIAERIVAALAAEGGRLTLEDFAGYQAKLRPPVWGDYRGYRIAAMPPPSSGGVHLVEILNMLEPLPLADFGLNAADTIHFMTEAMKRAYADRSLYLGDPDFVAVPVARLTDKSYAAARLAEIDPTRATPAADILPGRLDDRESTETTHFSVVDRWGNAVANTTTLNFSFGLGRVAPGTGILLNNELDDFAAKPGAANAYGLVGGDANAVAPRKRPLSSMTPAILFADGAPQLVTGSPGGSRIITTVLQVILNVVDHRLPIAEAIAAPRIHHQWQPDEIRIESGLSPDTIRLLEARGHQIRRDRAMGAAQSILRADGKWTAIADPRRPDGLALGH